MALRLRLLPIVALALILPVGSAAFAASDLATTIDKLNQAAAKFKSASADFVFDSITTEPVQDEVKQKGIVYYERQGPGFRMAAHIQEENGQPVPKVYTYSDGVFKLYQEKIDQVNILSKSNKLADYIMLGFGASGTQLQDKWDITDDGPETVNGIQTEKLELVAKDPNVKKNFPKITVWMDLNRAVNLKQVFDEGQGQSRTCTYSNIKTNQSLPGSVFTFKTDKNTHFVTQ
jgi:outer membrane lipoprotein-sorting protein